MVRQKVDEVSEIPWFMCISRHLFARTMPGNKNEAKIGSVGRKIEKNTVRNLGLRNEGEKNYGTYITHRNSEIRG